MTARTFAFAPILLLAALLSTPQRTSAGDWPQFLGPEANGISRETGLLKSWPAEGPPVIWEKEVGTGYSAPSVRAGRIILHHRVKDEEVVEAFDAATGQPQWRHGYPTAFIDPFGYNNGPRCSPLLTTNRCYAFGAEGRLVCLDLATGKLIWERSTGSDWTIPEAFFGVGSTPILEGGKLIVMVGAQPNAGVVAFDPETGKTLWESVGKNNWEGVPMTGWPGEREVVWNPSEKQASYATPVAATVHGRRRVFCFMRQGLVCLDPADGKVDFSFWFRARVNESVNAANPVVIGDTVFITAAYYKVGSVLLQIEPDGKKVSELWRSQVLETHWSTPIYHNGYLYSFSGRDEPDARFRCVEYKTGKLMWDRDERWAKYSSRQPPVYGRASAIVADGKLIVLGEGGKLGLFELNPAKCVEISSFQLPRFQHPCWAGPVLAEKRLYLRSESRLACLALAERE